MKIRLGLSLALLAVLLFIVSRSIDLHKIPGILSDLKPLALIELFLIACIISILKAWRFLILLRNTDIKITFWETLKTFMAGSAVTPLPGGEAMRGILLQKAHGVSVIKSTGPVVVQAYLELFSATILFFLGSLLYKYLRIPALIFFLIMIGIAIVLVNTSLFQFISTKMQKIPKISPFFQKLKSAQEHIRNLLYDEDTHLPDKVLVRTLGLSLLSNIAGGFLIFTTAQNLHLNLDFFKSIFIFSGGQVIQGIGTISPGGLGLTESGMIGLLLLSKIDITQAVALVIIYRLFTLFFNVILGLLFITFFYWKTLLFAKKEVSG